MSEIGGRLQFDFDKWGELGISGMEPLWLLRYLPNMPGCHIGIAVDARGPNNSITHDEASGGLAIAEAATIIRRNRADVMITGTTGTRLQAAKACQYSKWDQLAQGPAESRCRPFDRDRSGEVLAEASCTLILEAREHAEARGAKIWGTILGFGSSTVLGRDGKADDATAVYQAGSIALQNAGVKPADLGTSTPVPLAMLFVTSRKRPACDDCWVTELMLFPSRPSRAIWAVPAAVLLCVNSPHLSWDLMPA